RGQRARLVAEVAQGGLEVERRRVVGRRGDARLGQRGADRVALARAADEEVVDMAWVVLRQLHEVAEPELCVTGCGGAARLVPARDLRQEDAQERGLQLVEPGVVTDEVERRLVARAVEREELNALRELLVTRRHEPPVAEAEEVLGGIEAEGRDRPMLRDPGRAEGLGGVLLLERPVVRAADEALALEHLAESGLEPRDQRLVFGSYVNEGNRLHAGSL